MHTKEELEKIDIVNLRMIAYPYLQMGVKKYTPERKNDLINFILSKQGEKC